MHRGGANKSSVADAVGQLSVLHSWLSTLESLTIPTCPARKCPGATPRGHSFMEVQGPTLHNGCLSSSSISIHIWLWVKSLAPLIQIAGFKMIEGCSSPVYRYIRSSQIIHRSLLRSSIDQRCQGSHPEKALLTWLRNSMLMRLSLAEPALGSLLPKHTCVAWKM